MRRGFTLVELLLAAGIFSAIALSLYVTLSNGISLSRRSQTSENLYGEARWAIESLAQDLENMVAYRHVDFFNNFQGGFVGKEDGLSLFLPTEDGLKLVRYALLNPEEARRHQVLVHEATERNVTVFTGARSEERLDLLVRDERPFEITEESGKDSFLESEILSRHVREGSLRFSYAFTRQDGSLGWKEEWSEPFLPAGVRVEVTFWDPESPARPFPVERKIYIPTGSWGDESG